jgi:hypothetical protein
MIMERRDDAFLELAAWVAISGVDDGTTNIIFGRFDHFFTFSTSPAFYRISVGNNSNNSHFTDTPLNSRANASEARIMAGEDVGAVEIAFARGRLPNGRPRQSRSSARLADSSPVQKLNLSYILGTIGY